MIHITLREMGETPTQAQRQTYRMPLEKAVDLAIACRYGEFARVVWDTGSGEGPKHGGTYRAMIEPIALLPRRVVVVIGEQGELFQ